MAKKTKEQLMIIDGYALLYRAWHALPPLTTKKGEVVNAVYGFITVLFKALKEIEPTHVVVAMDMPGKTFRHKEYKEYKAQRQKQPPELYAQVDRIKALLEALGMPVIGIEGYEADDVIATICAKEKKKHPELEKIIVTGDTDTLQLVDETTNVYATRKGVTDILVYDQEKVEEKFDGLAPEKLKYFKALRGDPSDNIPGVKGVGEKTAIALVSEFGDLKNIYNALDKEDERISASVSKKLAVHKKDAELSLMLATMDDDVPLSFQLEDARLHEYDAQQVIALLQELEFKSLLTRIKDLPLIPKEGKQKKGEEHKYLLATEKVCDEALREAARQSVIAFDTETTSLRPFEACLVGVSMSWSAGEGYYFPYQELTASQKKKLKEILESSKIKKVGHNIKYDVEVLLSEDIHARGIFFDTMIAAYLLNPGVRGYGLDALAFAECGHEMIPITDLIGKAGPKQLTIDQVEVEKVSEYACEDADYTWRLYELFAPRIEKEGLEKLMYEMEMPTLEVLIEMEEKGVLVDTSFLDTLSKKLKKEKDKIQKEIFKLSKEEFNIDSPSQLRDILFDTLALPTQGIKKTKTGYSTASSELEKLQGVHPIIEYISKYRELAKLINTYVDVLPTLVNEGTGRIHTSYNQTIAATGRLSSTEPNLQNIPIKTEIGREIRKAFIAKKGYVLIAADYSQIELRVAAHLSGDRKMIEVFEAGSDIHTATAATMNNVPLKDVTKDMRRAAKAINFGVLYGMGPQGLAMGAGIPFWEAQEFIEKYYEAFPELKSYLERLIQKAREEGYTETMYGRKRYFPEIHSNVLPVRKAAERAAMNLPIQGTATGDIMKLAMIELQKKIKVEKNLSLEMILQVHDELVFEVKKGEEKKAAQLIRETMEGIVKLKVPLVVDVEAGKNWGELKTIKE